MSQCPCSAETIGFSPSLSQSLWNVSRRFLSGIFSKPSDSFIPFLLLLPPKNKNKNSMMSNSRVYFEIRVECPSGGKLCPVRPKRDPRINDPQSPLRNLTRPDKKIIGPPSLFLPSSPSTHHGRRTEGLHPQQGVHPLRIPSHPIHRPNSPPNYPILHLRPHHRHQCCQPLSRRLQHRIQRRSRQLGVKIPLLCRLSRGVCKM